MRGRCVAECAKLRMPGHALEGPSVVAPCADGSASDVADRSGVGSSGAGEEQRSRGGKRHKGDGAQLYGLSAVERLRDIFFSPKTQKLCIVSDGSAGHQKTAERLMQELARCSDYIESVGLSVPDVGDVNV